MRKLASLFRHCLRITSFQNRAIHLVAAYVIEALKNCAVFSTRHVTEKKRKPHAGGVLAGVLVRFRTISKA